MAGIDPSEPSSGIPSLDCCNKRSKYPKSDPPRRNTGEGSRREAWQKCNIEKKSKREAGERKDSDEREEVRKGDGELSMSWVRAAAAHPPSCVLQAVVGRMVASIPAPS
uniref:Uncharacterized protein n=1 Tax=Vespula pensylvanica TaxID=30213 RepID=A0A834P6K1_VESPE|nr:hypothetical protein H0235_006422 [Vespula pensylvanica]